VGVGVGVGVGGGGKRGLYCTGAVVGERGRGGEGG
jgi:hypothetical protein